MLLTILVAVLTLFILYRYVVFPVGNSVASSYEFRFFILLQVVCLLGIGVIVAEFDPTINSVLKRSSIEGFLLAKIVIVGFLGLLVVIFGLFDAIERRECRSGKGGDTFRLSNLNNGIAIAMVGLALTSTLLLIAVYGIPQMMLFAGVSGDELALARTEKLHNSSLVPSFVRRLLARDLSVFLSFVFWARLCLGRCWSPFYKSKTKLLVILLVVMAAYNVSFELSKSKLVEYLLFLILIKYSADHISKNKRPSILLSIFLGGGLLAMILWIFSLTHPEWPLMQVLTYFLSRLFVSQVSPFIYTASAYEAGLAMGSPSELVLYLGEVFKVTSYTAPGQHLTSILFPDAYYSGKMNYLSTFLLSDVIWLFGLWFVPVFSIYILVLIRGWLYFKARMTPSDVFLGASGFVFYGSNFMSAATPYVLSASVTLIASVILVSWYKFKVKV